MGDAIIMVVILIVLIFAVRGSLKHFKGEGACCGGGSGSVKPKKPKKKTLDGPVIGRCMIRHFRHALPELCEQCDKCA